MNLTSALGAAALLAAMLLPSCAPYDPYAYGAPPPRAAYPRYGYSPYGYAPYGYGPSYSSLSVGWFGGGWWGNRGWRGRDCDPGYGSHHHPAPTRTVSGYRTVHAGTYQRDPRPLEPFVTGSRPAATAPTVPGPSTGFGTFDRGSPSRLRAGSSLPSSIAPPPSSSRIRESHPPTLSPSRPPSSLQRGSSGSPSSSRGSLRASTGGRGSSLVSTRSSSAASRFSRERR